MIIYFIKNEIYDTIIPSRLCYVNDYMNITVKATVFPISLFFK